MNDVIFLASSGVVSLLDPLVILTGICIGLFFREAGARVAAIFVALLAITALMAYLHSKYLPHADYDSTTSTAAVFGFFMRLAALYFYSSIAAKAKCIYKETKNVEQKLQPFDQCFQEVRLLVRQPSSLADEQRIHLTQLLQQLNTLLEEAEIHFVLESRLARLKDLLEDIENRFSALQQQIDAKPLN